MWIAILGPLLVHDGETPIDVPQGRLRALLAALALHAGDPVSADVLAEAVWDGSPPSGAKVTLRSHVLRLRRALGPRVGARLVTRHPGYLLQAAEKEVDVLRFRSLCREGGTALREGVWDRADGLLGEALSLWRGAALADVPCALLRGEASGLEALLLQAEEWRIDAALRLGRHAELIPGLQSLAAGHPMRERFHGQLMLALYRSGRQAEALAAYQRARDILVTELGIEPGPDLRDLHKRILSADLALTGAETALPGLGEPRRDTPLELPRELPPAVPGFTGRLAELQALNGLLDRSGEQAPGTVVISAIGGTAGVGKTALAVYWAHQVADHFPDGQLYVNLRGYDPGPPVSAADALAGFLLSSGVPGHDIPAETEQRAARYRSLLAGKQMLVVLDNARSADQVRPLLPGTPTCTVIVTSRDALAGLVARDGAARLDLDVLPQQEAIALLRALIGARAAAEPAATAELASQCCRLPLALRVAAELAASRPAVPLSALTGELADPRTRLDQLDAGGDPGTQVRAVFSWSYRHLDTDTARAFRLAGLHPGLDLEPYATAALANTAVPQSRRTLDALAHTHLLFPAAPGRYGMPDLLRAYAAERAAADETPASRAAAVRRVLTWYLHTADQADRILMPARRHVDLAELGPLPGEPLTFGTYAEALAWCDVEHANLVAATLAAAEAGEDGIAWRLPVALWSYFTLRKPWADWIMAGHAAAVAARRVGDREGEAWVLRGLSRPLCGMERFSEALACLRRSLCISRETGDRSAESVTLNNIGTVYGDLGRIEDATGYFRDALRLASQTGYRRGEAIAQLNLGEAYHKLSKHSEAVLYFRQALRIAGEVDDVQIEAQALSGLGEAELVIGQLAAAQANLWQAIAAWQRVGDLQGEAETRCKLADFT